MCCQPRIQAWAIIGYTGATAQPAIALGRGEPTAAQGRDRRSRSASGPPSERR